ncbi:hypothetical protein ACLOJK_017012 [Asimina triloba]
MQTNRAVKQSHCFQSKGDEAECSSSGNLFMMAFGASQIFLSQLPSLHNITWLSVVAAAMSFGYSFIGLCLGVVQWISHGEVRGSAAGAALGSHGLVSAPAKAWLAFQALGNIAFAYAFAEVLIEIQDTLKSPPPENKTMKKATMYGIGLTTAFYLLLGCTGYAAFGDNAPGNIFSVSGFYKPFWLVDVANLFIVIHLLGAYQVFAQPIFAFFEKWVATKWPDAKLIHSIYTIRLPFRDGRSLNLILSKLILRSIFIVFTTLVAMLFPFFNAVLGLLGALAFWPLAVYFPVSMYMVQSKVARGMPKWFLLHGLNFLCLAVSILATVGSVADIAENLAHARPFHTHS